MSSPQIKKSLVQIFQEFEMNIQLYHWTTESFSRHKASDKLYESIGEHVDKFMEVFMGKYGRPVLKNGQQTLIVKKMSDSEFTSYLKEKLVFFQSNLPQLLSQNDTDLLNIRDEIIGDINQVLYLCILK